MWSARSKILWDIYWKQSNINHFLSRTNIVLTSVSTKDYLSSKWEILNLSKTSDQRYQELELTLIAIFFNLFIAENWLSRVRTAESRGLSGATPPTRTHGWPEIDNKQSFIQFKEHPNELNQIYRQINGLLQATDKLRNCWVSINLWMLFQLLCHSLY